MLNPNDTLPKEYINDTLIKNALPLQFYEDYPQYRYLIEEPKAREKFLELLQEQTVKVELSQEYTPIEKEKIITMLWHVAQLNQNADQELAYARQRVQNYAAKSK